LPEDRACAASRGDQGGAQRAGVRLSRSLGCRRSRGRGPTRMVSAQRGGSGA
jgi:hypothetical protein